MRFSAYQKIKPTYLHRVPLGSGNPEKVQMNAVSNVKTYIVVIPHSMYVASSTFDGMRSLIPMLAKAESRRCPALCKRACIILFGPSISARTSSPTEKLCVCVCDSQHIVC